VAEDLHDVLDLIDFIAASPAAQELARALEKGAHAMARGAAGSSTSLLAAALARIAKRPTLLVVAHLDDADECEGELSSLGVRVVRLPALEALPGETAAAMDLFALRVRALREIMALHEGDACVVVAPIPALMQGVHPPARLEQLCKRFARGQDFSQRTLIDWLASVGYARREAIEEPGDFAVRGGIVDVFPPGASSDAGSPSLPVRLDFFGDEIDRIHEIDLATMGSDREVESCEIVCADAALVKLDASAIQPLSLVPGCVSAIVSETMEVVEQGRGYYERVTDPAGIFGPPAVLKTLREKCRGLAEVGPLLQAGGAGTIDVELPIRQLPQIAEDIDAGIAELASLAHEGARLECLCANEGESTRLGELIAQYAPNDAKLFHRRVAYLHRGFAWDEPERNLALVPYHEVVHRYTTRRSTQRLRGGRTIEDFIDFAEGDIVVHADHGICRFAGLTQMPPRPLPGRPASKDGEMEEYLTLEFAGRSKLHVPATQIDLVQKYVGGFAGKPTLSTLGGQRWKKQKEQVSESVRDLAAEMLRVRAARESMPGTRFPDDTPWQHEFEAEFPYEETEDQATAILAAKRDMSSERPMDRLICGDVGFGKTEVAIRAAFKAVEFGRQVAVLVPTTVLAEQHERTFRSRFAGYPFRIESLSRFKTTGEINQVLAALRKGQVDVIIGTHRLLSKDVHFADLGLVVVDEEHRFGVEHKERLLQLRLTVDVLTLSATPIPRTLHMAMLGLRDISSLTTPPLDRRAVVTEVIPWNDRRIRQAIARELAREGQVFFVHNRVHDIQSVADDVAKLSPEGARIVVGHGQMAPHELEEVILRFIRRDADILVSTTIIESGIDIPTANTMIIADADRFGLADLHQLRGRVGRSKHRAYCYLLLPKERAVKETAQKRLKALEEYSMLGAGFKIAMRDLEIRGAGNLLGAEQSGHIAAVGYDLYCQLLERAVKELKNDEIFEPPSTTSVEIGVVGLIPRGYIPSDRRRLEAYRRLATADSLERLARVEADLTSAYGSPPQPVQRLIELASVRIAASRLGVRAISVRERDVIFRTRDPGAIEQLLVDKNATVRTLPPEPGTDLHMAYYRPPENYLEPVTLLRVLRARLGAKPPSAPDKAGSRDESDPSVTERSPPRRTTPARG
jgi:transcription-repair coupling factor (superfamily II helicase)